MSRNNNGVGDTRKNNFVLLNDPSSHTHLLRANTVLLISLFQADFEMALKLQREEEERAQGNSTSPNGPSYESKQHYG